jgi:hypothetical protein
VELNGPPTARQARGDQWGTEMAQQGEKSREDRAYEMRTRGIAFVVLGAIPTVIGVLAFPTFIEGNYGDVWVPVLLVAGLAVVAVGAAFMDRAKKLRDGI